MNYCSALQVGWDSHGFHGFYEKRGKPAAAPTSQATVPITNVLADLWKFEQMHTLYLHCCLYFKTTIIIITVERGGGGIFEIPSSLPN